MKSNRILEAIVIGSLAGLFAVICASAVVACGRPWLTCKELQVGAAADAGTDR